jgi:hypothetical protein
MSHGGLLLIVFGALAVAIFIAVIRRHRRSASTDPVKGAMGMTRGIAERDGKQSPAVLVHHARAALVAGRPKVALDAARRARDRSDDFVNALPLMTGKVPLRPMVYHPAIYETMLVALNRCRADRLLNAGQAGEVALSEWQASDNDLHKVHSSGDDTFWRLYLSDYLQLCALAYESLPATGAPNLTRNVVLAVLQYADGAPAGGFTMPGVLAYQSLQRAVGREVPPGTPPARERPRDYDRFPCGALIDQAEIDRWSSSDRVSNQPESAVNMPEYSTSRPRFPRPATTNMEALYSLSLRQIGVAQSVPDAWWAAVDIAIYRWELLSSYDEQATNWVESIVTDIWTVMERATPADGPPWTWGNVADLFQYCYERVVALIPTIDRARPLDLIHAQGHENVFAYFLDRTFREAGDVQRRHAFENRLYITLCRNHRLGLSAGMMARLRMLELRFGPCP